MGLHMAPTSHTCEVSGVCSSTVTDFNVVKLALEGCYAEMGITCEDVGGLWDSASQEYFSLRGDARPCAASAPACISSTSPPAICEDDCAFNGRDVSNNNICQDGGPGSEAARCAL